MHPDQIDIATEQAARLIAEQFPALAGEPLRRLAGAGTVNAIFRIGESATARFPLRHQDPQVLAGRLATEAEAMAEFAALVPVPAPVPLGLGRPGHGYPMPFGLQSWIAGEVATPDGLAASDAFADDIAGLISTLRRVACQGRRFDGRGRGGHLPDHDAWVSECLERSRALLDVARLGPLWSRVRALPEPGRECMSHRDLIPANLLVRDGRLAGVLDTGSFGPADPALDLVAAWHLFDAPRRELIRNRLGCSDLEWQRGAAWAFEQAIGLVWYYDRSNPAMAALGRSTLARLLEAEGG